MITYHSSFHGGPVGTGDPLNPLFYYILFPSRKERSFVHAEHINSFDPSCRTYKFIDAVHNACLKVPKMKFDIKMGQILKVRTCSRLRPIHGFGFWVDDGGPRNSLVRQIIICFMSVE